MQQYAWTKTKFTKLLQLSYPIVQGPFGGGVSSVALAATVTKLGGLGSIGCESYTPAQIFEAGRAIREVTDRPFNFNLWVNNRDAGLNNFDAAAYEKWTQFMQPYFDEVGVAMPKFPVDLGPSFEEQMAAVLEVKPAVFSFVYGIPSEDLLEQCRRNGTKTVGTATTVDEAVALENAGVDAIVATGFEAGGHRVSFLDSAENSLTGLFALLPQVADSVTIPVIAAGGIADARGIKAALALGASAVQIGTAFLATDESGAQPRYRQKLFSSDAKNTTLTKLLSGRLARGVRSRLTEELKDKEHLLAPYPLQGKFMSLLRAALLEGRASQYFTVWAGQSASLIRHTKAAALFNDLVSETNKLCK